MIIDLASVGVSPKAISEVFASEAIGLSDEGKLLGNATFSGEMFRAGEKVHVRGKIEAEVELSCTRCLEPIRKDLDIAFDDVFVDAADEPKADEIELPLEALDEELVSDGKIDLVEVVREQMVLELPEKTLCGEHCKGLCPQCGENLNLIDCSCESDDIDPRWAALKNLN